MKFRRIFIALSVVFFGANIALMWILAGSGNLAFYITEGVVFLSMLLLFFFYGKIIKSFDTIANGIDLLREQDFSSRLLPVGQHEADRIVDMFNRIMAQLKEERLHVREQNHFMDLLIAASPMGIVIFDSKGCVSMCNGAAAKFLGCSSVDALVGRPVEDSGSALGRVVARMPYGGVETMRLSDSMIYRCSRLSFMDKGYAHQFVMIEKLTTEVMKAERKAYEKVIRMIAHEVNNSMAGVNSMLDSVSAAVEDIGDDDLLELIKVCEQRCMSMSRFITSFAAVVKIPDAVLCVCDLNECVGAAKVLLESMCGLRDVKLHMELCEEEVPVMLDRVLMEQALINMVKNSTESLVSGGDVTIVTSASPPTLAVIDNGPGISDEVENKLFSPFFSTKPDGQGIGLLFISDVLNKHKCTFSLRTGDDGLTRFSVIFPR